MRNGVGKGWENTISAKNSLLAFLFLSGTVWTWEHRGVCFSVFLFFFNPENRVCFSLPGNKEPCEKLSSPSSNQTKRQPTRRTRHPQGSKQEGEHTGSALGNAIPSTVLSLAHRIPGPASSSQKPALEREVSATILFRDGKLRIFRSECYGFVEMQLHKSSSVTRADSFLLIFGTR